MSSLTDSTRTRRYSACLPTSFGYGQAMYGHEMAFIDGRITGKGTAGRSSTTVLSVGPM